MSGVILIQPPVREFYLTRKRTVPYGLASIAASLHQHGIRAEIIDALARNKSKPLPFPPEFNHLSPYYGRSDISLFSLFHQFRHFGYSHGHLASMVRERRPLVVGISSLFTAYQDQAMATAEAVRQFCPDVYIVMGGHHPTLFPDETLACTAVDFVLRGEGEVSMSKLCVLLSAYANKREQGAGRFPPDADLKKIPGIAFRQAKGGFVSAPSWTADLDHIPPPDMGNVDQAYYARNKKATITVVASRGCPFPCTYCSVSASSSHGRFRQRSVRDVLAEIRAQADQREIGFIDFEDENLTLQRDWAMALFSGIREIFRGRPVELRAMNGLFPPSLDTDLMAAMKAAGFKTLNLSLGSFSKEQLTRYRRPDVTRAHDRVLDMAEGLGLETVSYIIGAGPGQTAAVTLSDLLMLARRRTLAGLSIFYPAPGSADYEVCKQEGILPETFSLMRSTALPLDHATTRLEAVTLLRLSRILNFLKHWIDSYGSLPAPEAFSQEKADQLSGETDREMISNTLVRWFLAGGVIRGMDADGNIYPHTTDANLCRQFVKGVIGAPLRGVRRPETVIIE
ncbi:MAG: radical SAM protein [Desulfobacter sp.]